MQRFKTPHPHFRSERGENNGKACRREVVVRDDATRPGQAQLMVIVTCRWRRCEGNLGTSQSQAVADFGDFEPGGEDLELAATIVGHAFLLVEAAGGMVAFDD